MKNYKHTFAIAGLAALMSGSALANVNSVKSMKDEAPVTLTGTVDSIKNEREFTLRDSSGTIDVDIESNQSVVLKKGDNVTVTGKVDNDVLGTDINANEVMVNKGVARALGDAIEGNTGVSLEGATSYEISNLPKEGLVKVSGTVTDVDNEKEFTIKDPTGSINVDIESSEAAAVTEGTEVTVIGYVDQGMFGKDINARKVLVVSDARASRQ